MSSSKAIVKSADMSNEMQTAAIEAAEQALSKYDVERDVAKAIKEAFDKEHGEPWHCIVGKSFGSFVTHDSGHFLYFYLGDTAILLFKTS